MSSGDSHQGPLSVADLLAVWTAAVDRGYQEPLVGATVGSAGFWVPTRTYAPGETVGFEGSTYQALPPAPSTGVQPGTDPTKWALTDSGGLEVYTQLMAQLARASVAVDVTTQALYIRPWSGQTAPPAAGEARATVTLTLTRDKLVDRPLRLGAGQILVDEQTTDWGDPGGVVVRTGRRYVLRDDVVFLPGEAGPVDVLADAEKPGWGYNNPLPDTLVAVDQPGTGFYHDRATVTVAVAPVPATQPPPQLAVYLVTVNEADTFVPEHVGQHMLFTAGANAGKDARIISYAGPDPDMNLGSTVGLENLAAFESTAVAGTFQVGELVQIRTGGPTVVGWARLVAAHLGAVNRFGIVVLTGALAGAVDVFGQVSVATATVDFVTADPVLVAESPPPASGGPGASWRVLDWVADWGLSVTNVLSPTGGRLGYLDAIGYERSIPRSPAEADEAYRERVGEVADVVTPNAIRRALNRSLGAIPYCFREVGSALLPGVYYDGDGVSALAHDSGTGNAVDTRHALRNTAYDYDTLVLTGTYTGTPPQDANGAPLYADEAVLFNAGGDAKVLGWTGRIDGPGGGATLTLIRRQGLGTLANPYVFVAGDTVVSQTGAYVFTVGAYLPFTDAAVFRWRCYLDYEQFRAFFAVGVPRVGFGEFGFAWGGNFWDLGPTPNFFDGFPAGAPAFYGRVWAAVEKARAGGVSWNLFLTDGAACV